MRSLYSQINRIQRRRELLRGRWFRAVGATSGQRFGVGKGVKIEYPECLTVEDDVTINDYGYLHCLSAKGVQIGHHTSFDRNLWLHCGGTPGNYDHGFVHIGSHSYIGCNAVLGAGGGISIGDNVLIGQHVSFHAENHAFSDTSRLIRDQGVTYEGIVVESNVWVASRAIVLDGVTIGTGSVVGAGAVVTKSIPPYSLAVGVPAQWTKLYCD